MREKYSPHGGTYLDIDSYTEDGSSRVEETYREHFARLRTIEKNYDPMNLFRLNANILPEV